MQILHYVFIELRIIENQRLITVLLINLMIIGLVDKMSENSEKCPSQCPQDQGNVLNILQIFSLLWCKTQKNTF